MARRQRHNFRDTEITVTIREAQDKGGPPTGAQRSCAAPSKEQATKVREQALPEVELQAGSPTPFVGSVEQQDKDPPVLDVEQI
ncbi:hypothetical protein NDU88_006600 [Pleurodeles waltl]|uniref:Uncharacterized protein n=1 Tax=Pleurodeles waltl TaxID=8319 RepID=A0AAV7QJ79_PLEWA|nr:hypothetical protein NDU88_006600 [Pleurodeles waltl]